MEIIKNENKDLAEIRDSETGKLLGWLPENILPKEDPSRFEIVIPDKADVSNAPLSNVSMEDAGEIRTAVLQRNTLFWRSKLSYAEYKINTWHTTNEEFLKLTEKITNA